MKACLAVLPCLILAALDPALASQEDYAVKVHAASVLEERGDFADAERILRGILKDAADLGPDDPRKGLILYELGFVYHSEGRYLEAETSYRSAIQVWKGHGIADVPLIPSMRSLAALYIETGQYRKAERLGLASFATRLETTMPDSVELAGLTGTLGSLASARGEYGKAEACFRRALALWEKLRPNGRERLRILLDLGTLYFQEARYAEARTYAESALALAEALVTRDRPYEVRLLASMAAVMVKTEGTAQAIRFYKKAIALGESALGPAHPVLGAVLLDYALVLRLAKQKAEAKICQRRAEAILKASNRNVRTYSIDVTDLQRSSNLGINSRPPPGK